MDFRALFGALIMAVGAVTSAQAENLPTIADAHRQFFNAQYQEAAASALELRVADPGDLAACELRTSALLFQIRRELENPSGAPKPFARCERCPNLLAAFLSETVRGQALARSRLKADASDDTALFFLGKIDLNYVWLQLGPLARKNGLG